MSRNIVIVGNGIAGITAARMIRKGSAEAVIRVISGESEHFYSRTALMYIYMGHLSYENTKPYEDRFWPANRIELIRGWAAGVDPETKRVLMSDGEHVGYDTLIIASGSVPRPFGCPGEELRGVTGLYGLRDLAAVEEYTRGIERGVVVGGGLIGVELAEMLRSRHIGVTMLVREKEYWSNILPDDEGRLVGRHIRAHGVDLRTGTELREIRGDDAGRVRSVVTMSGEEIPCQFVGMTIGVQPNVAWLRNVEGLEIGRGVMVDDYFRTTLPDVYAVGDCVEFRDACPGHPPIEQLWYTGRIHGETVARTILGRLTEYDRGVWFNSAKFFDIEYQTYGLVPPAFGDHDDCFYWESADGCRALRVVYRKADRIVIGAHTFGIRHRHDVWESWLRAGRDIDDVMRDLRLATFDPEFSRRHEREILRAYESES